MVQYLKPRPDELYYPDSDGSIAVHYAARCAATDKTEVLRYLSFICEAAYLKEIDNVPVCVCALCGFWLLFIVVIRNHFGLQHVLGRLRNAFS